MRLAIKEAVVADSKGVFEASMVGSAAPGLAPAAFSGGGRVGVGLEYNVSDFGFGVFADSFLKDILEKKVRLRPAVGISWRF
jgi:hypothetical protein